MCARLYYGSGERRFLTIQHSSESLFSEFSASVHNSPLISRPPSIKRFTPGTQLPPQRRPPPAPCEAPSPLQSASDGPVPCPPLNMVCRIKKQTSSIWSPHLRRDRRSRRYNLWRPPSTVWIKEEHISRRSNIQAILFVSGFVFPFGKDELIFDMIISTAKLDSSLDDCVISSPATNSGGRCEGEES